MLTDWLMDVLTNDLLMDVLIGVLSDALMDACIASNKRSVSAIEMTNFRSSSGGRGVSVNTCMIGCVG